VWPAIRFTSFERETIGVASGFWTNPMAVTYLRSSLAVLEGDSAAAARITLDAHDRFRDSLPPGDRRYFLTIETLLEAGKSVEAEQLFAEWQELVPDDALGVYRRTPGAESRPGSPSPEATSRGRPGCGRNTGESVRVGRHAR